MIDVHTCDFVQTDWVTTENSLVDIWYDIRVVENFSTKIPEKENEIYLQSEYEAFIQMLNVLEKISLVYFHNSIFVFSTSEYFSNFSLLFYLIEWKWSPTDAKGNSLALANGGSLTFLPNMGSVALFLVIALVYTLLGPIGKLF